MSSGGSGPFGMIPTLSFTSSKGGKERSAESVTGGSGSSGGGGFDGSGIFGIIPRMSFRSSKSSKSSNELLPDYMNDGGKSSESFGLYPSVDIENDSVELFPESSTTKQKFGSSTLKSSTAFVAANDNKQGDTEMMDAPPPPAGVPTRLNNLALATLARLVNSTTKLRKRTMLPIGYVPGNLDICCGRGKRNWNHSGNVFFRSFIRNNVARYLAAPTKNDKTLVVISIVDEIRHQGGGFLKEDTRGRWYDIGDAQARDKVGHSLRDQVTAQSRHKQKKNASVAATMANVIGITNTITDLIPGVPKLQQPLSQPQKQPSQPQKQPSQPQQQPTQPQPQPQPSQPQQQPSQPQPQPQQQPSLQLPSSQQPLLQQEQGMLVNNPYEYEEHLPRFRNDIRHLHNFNQTLWYTSNLTHLDLEPRPLHPQSRLSIIPFEQQAVVERSFSIQSDSGVPEFATDPSLRRSSRENERRESTAILNNFSRRPSFLAFSFNSREEQNKRASVMLGGDRYAAQALEAIKRCNNWEFLESFDDLLDLETDFDTNLNVALTDDMTNTQAQDVNTHAVGRIFPESRSSEYTMNFMRDLAMMHESINTIDPSRELTLALMRDSMRVDPNDMRASFRAFGDQAFLTK